MLSINFLLYTNQSKQKKKDLENDYFARFVKLKVALKKCLFAQFPEVHVVLIGLQPIIPAVGFTLSMDFGVFG